MNHELTIYSQAKKVLAEYKTVDEVKDYRDKALAIEAYAKQANDFELEYHAAAARVRAERRCGELLREMEKAKGAQGNSSNQHQKEVRSVDATAPKTLAEMGLTKDQSSKFQKLASVPEEEFEDLVNIPGAKPSTSHILAKIDPPPEPPRIDELALWWWGRLCEIEEERMPRPLSEIVADMTEEMQDDAIRVIPKLKAWVENYEKFVGKTD